MTAVTIRRHNGRINAVLDHTRRRIRARHQITPNDPESHVSSVAHMSTYSYLRVADAKRRASPSAKETEVQDTACALLEAEHPPPAVAAPCSLPDGVVSCSWFSQWAGSVYPCRSARHCRYRCALQSSNEGRRGCKYPPSFIPLL